jgi:cell fate (sporulation/competence/biofilm development) regulator YlbF (YheA/YmcA/DUF963 family)
MKKQEIEGLTRKALLYIGMCNKNNGLSEIKKDMTYLHKSHDNYNSFLEVFSKLKQAVETQKTFDNLTNLRNQAHFKMKRAQHNDWLMEYAQYQSEVDLYDKRIEILKTK